MEHGSVLPFSLILVGRRGPSKNKRIGTVTYPNTPLESNVPFTWAMVQHVQLNSCATELPWPKAHFGEESVMQMFTTRCLSTIYAWMLSSLLSCKWECHYTFSPSVLLWAPKAQKVAVDVASGCFKYVWIFPLAITVSPKSRSVLRCSA